MVDFYHGTLGLPFLLPYQPEEEWAAIEAGNVTIYIFKSEVGEHEPRRTPVNPENAPASTPSRSRSPTWTRPSRPSTARSSGRATRSSRGSTRAARGTATGPSTTRGQHDLRHGAAQGRRPGRSGGGIGVTALPLAGRVAVVTGGARGMGRSHCELLSERGASIVLCDLDGDVAQEAAAAIVASGGRAVAAATDVGDRAQCEALVALAVEAFGGIDVLVHNAGRLPCGARLEDTDDDVWHALFAVNAHGPMYLTRAALPHLRKSAAPRVIFISSQWGQVGPGHSHAYIASKTAMIGLAKNLALELAPEGILVNAVRPARCAPAWCRPRTRPRRSR